MTSSGLRPAGAGVARSGITVLHRAAHVQQERLARAGASIVDVTSRGALPWRRFSPFFPHGGIPVPLWPDRTAASVEGIWQGLKRFEHDDVDLAMLDVATMRGLKRTSRARGARGVPRGRVLGHQAGADAGTLLGYVEARRRIYLPAYRWVLEHPLRDDVERLRTLVESGPVVLLDFTTNGDLDDSTKPLSHAALLKAYLEHDWPRESG